MNKKNVPVAPMPAPQAASIAPTEPQGAAPVAVEPGPAPAPEPLDLDETLGFKNWTEEGTNDLAEAMGQVVSNPTPAQPALAPVAAPVTAPEPAPVPQEASTAPIAPEPAPEPAQAVQDASEGAQPVAEGDQAVPEDEPQTLEVSLEAMEEMLEQLNTSAQGDAAQDVASPLPTQAPPSVPAGADPNQTLDPSAQQRTTVPVPNQQPTAPPALRPIALTPEQYDASTGSPEGLSQLLNQYGQHVFSQAQESILRSLPAMVAPMVTQTFGALTQAREFLDSIPELKAYPSVVENEFQKVLAANPGMPVDEVQKATKANLQNARNMAAAIGAAKAKGDKKINIRGRRPRFAPEAPGTRPRQGAPSTAPPMTATDQAIANLGAMQAENDQGLAELGLV